MGKNNNKNSTIISGRDNSETVRDNIAKYNNIVVCGIQGVGKITTVVNALKGMDNVYFIENNFDYDGKLKAQGYSKYIKYIVSLKKDIKIIKDIRSRSEWESFLSDKNPKIIIIDGIYGRDDFERERFLWMLGSDNVRVVLIVRCIKHIGQLMRSFNMIVELTYDGALLLSIESAEVICKVLKDKDL